MIFKKNLLMYIILFFLILTLIISTFSLAFDENSIYVWSNFSSISTSTTPTEEEKQAEDNNNLTR